MSSRFVRPETTILRISQGDTLTVKRRLTAGEQRAAFVRMYLPTVTGDLKVNPLQTGIARMAAFLVDWSLTDSDGRIVPIRDQSIETVLAALDALDPESFAEINAAIDAHETAMATERAEEKKMALTSGVEAISSSRSVATGQSSGSETLM